MLVKDRFVDAELIHLGVNQEGLGPFHSINRPDIEALSRGMAPASGTRTYYIHVIALWILLYVIDILSC